MTEEVPGRILVVDDNISNLHLLVRMLSNHGYIISVAKSGNEALEVAQKSPLDLILLDIMMTGMNGYATCEMLKTNPSTRNIPVIFLSALDDVTSKTKGFEVGGVDYVSKPFHEAEVMARINTHLSLSQARKNLERTIDQLSLKEEEIRQNYNEMLEKDREIRESEDKFRTIFSLVPDAILLTRISDGTIIDCNHAMADLIGKPRSDLIGVSTIGLQIWKNEGEWLTYVAEIQKSGGIENREFLWEKNNRETQILLFSSRVIEIRGEKVIINVGFDYTALKRAEQQLKDSEEMYRNPVEQSPVGVFLFQDESFRYVNPRLAMMFGYSRDELQNIPVEQLIAAPDLPKVRDILFNPDSVHYNERHLEFRGIRSSRTTLELDLYASHMQYQGRPAVYGTIIDVTYRNQIEEARYQSEKKYRLIAENMKDVVCILDSQTWSFRYVSPSIKALCGYSAEEIMARSLADITTPETFADMQKSVERRLVVFRENPDAQEWGDIHLQHVCKDGSVIQTGVVTSFLTNRVTGTIEVLCVIRDITQRVLAEKVIERNEQELSMKNEELVAANEELIATEQERIKAYNELAGNQERLMEQEKALTEANKEKEILLREIHHRVKNNMQVISSLLSLQSRSIQDPTIQMLFRETQTRVRSLSLVHELLYKSDSLKNIEYRKYLMDLKQIMFASHNTSRKDITCTIADHKVQISIGKAVPCSLVITELITNSLKYAFSDGRKGEIHIDFQYDPDKSCYCLRYRDNGVGFPKGMDPAKNTGFGSMLIQGLTRQLSGNIRIEDANPGVLYILEFPAEL